MSAVAVVLGLVISLDAQAKGNASHGAGALHGNHASHKQDSHKQHASKHESHHKFDLAKHGKKHLHWTKHRWFDRYHRDCYFCPQDSVWYFYEPACECYVPCEYATDFSTSAEDGDE